MTTHDKTLNNANRSEALKAFIHTSIKLIATKLPGFFLTTKSIIHEATNLVVEKGEEERSNYFHRLLISGY